MADPKIKYDIEANVKGDAEVGQLAGKLEALAKTLDGDLKTNANAAAAALRQLGDKQTAIARFVELKQGAQDAAAKLNDAQAAAQKMGQTLAATETPTRAQTGQMQKLGDAVRVAKAEVLAQNEAVQQARGALQQYGIGTQNLSQTQAGLAQSMGNAIRAANTQKASIDEVRESDRLLAIQEKALAAELEKGRIALLAEGAAQRDAAALARKTAAEKAALAQAVSVAADKWQREAHALVEAAEAAQKAKRAADLLIEAERFLAAETARATLAQQAAAAEQKRLADAATAAAQRIQSAFSTVGAKSVAELRAEIDRVRAAMETIRTTSGVTGAGIAGAFAAGEAKIKALEREIREASGTLTIADKTAKLFSNSLGQIAAGNIVANGVAYLSNKVRQLGDAFLEAVVQGDQLRRGLTAVYGDAAIAARQIDFLRKSSSESGVAVGELAGEFVKFSASMKSANIPLDQSNALFKAVTAASASLGLGTEATAGALNALGQMASKGVVSMEELRQQLGDRLPGALGLSAKGLGITEAQLIKLVESGQLATRDFIGPFTEALGSMRGEVDGLVPAWDRFKGLLTESAQGVGDAGGVTVLTGALKILGGFVGGLVMSLSFFVETLFLVGAAVVATAGQLTGNTKAWEFFGEQVEKSTNRLANQGRALAAFVDPAKAAADATSKVAASMTAATAATVKTIESNTALSGSQRLAALSAALAADATLNASAKIVQYGVASAELLSAQQAQTAAFEKSAKAAKQQGDTLVSLAKLTEDQAALHAASVTAAELYAAAIDKVAVSQNEELSILLAQKAELQESVKTRGLDAKEIKVQVDALDKKIASSRAETEQATQASIAARAELFERKLAVEALKDHSAEVGKFKAAMEAAARTLAEYERLALNGKKTDADVEQARRALTKSTVLYRDAVSDLISKLDLETRAKQASLQMSISQTNTAQKHAEVMAAQARALGNSTQAQYYEIQAKELAIKTLKLEMQMRALEAEAALKTIELKRLEITGTDDVSKKKLALLDIEAALIKVKLAGNDAAKETIAGIENEISALRRGVGTWGENTSARSANTEAMQKQADALDLIAMKYELSADYTESQIALLNRLTAATERATAAENKRLNRDSEGFSIDPKTGQRVNMQVDNQRSVYERAKGQGLTDAQALQISRQFMTEQGEKTGWNDGGRNGARQGETWDTALQKAINEVVLRNAANTANGGATTAAARPDTPTTVNINLNGSTQRVKTDADGARVLQDVLAQLGNAKSTSSR